MNGKLVSTRTIPCSPEAPDPNVISLAGEIIKKGGLVVYPTDTFYGLGGDPSNIKSIQKIFNVKGRSMGKPLPLIIYHRDVLKDWVSEIPPLSVKLMDFYWPGPLTIIFPGSQKVSSLLTAGTGKIGLRWPKFPIATAMARETDSAIISTSANLSGKGGITHPDEALKDLGGLVDLIIDSGELKPSLGSTIVDATGGHIQIIREGDLSIERILKIEENWRSR
ncbi:MAG: L-threonylcarbamoyladenylate synthase [bacterium]